MVTKPVAINIECYECRGNKCQICNEKSSSKIILASTIMEGHFNLILCKTCLEDIYESVGDDLERIKEQELK